MLTGGDGGLDPGAALTGALRVADAALWSLLGLRLDAHTANGADVHGWLSGAPLQRTEVHQATGMIIGQLGGQRDRRAGDVAGFRVRARPAAG